jgi:aminoglycoside phosphotransferase (APT) family kinase protein
LSGLLARWGHGALALSLRDWADRTAEQLAGHPSRVSLVHGDLWPGNVLAQDGVVTGVIDWDQAAPHDAALHDILHFTLYPAARERRSDLGLIVREALVNDGWEGELGKVLRQRRFHDRCLDIGMESRDALIWYWLRHTARMSAEPGHANNPRWVSKNVVAVANAIEMGTTK